MLKKQNTQLGFILAINTAIMWGVVPIAMKFVISTIDAYTISWFRFVVAFLGLTCWLYHKNSFPKLSLFKCKKRFVLLFVSGFGLMGNFALFAFGVKYLEPTASQIVAQLGIVMFLISNVIVFKEALRVTQIIGIIVLIIGLTLFFNKNISDLFYHFNQYGIGVWLTILAAVSWTIYALAQKVLLKELRAEQILWLLYFICAFFLFFLATPASLLKLNDWQWFALFFCGINTLVAYGSLVAAMEYWNASEVTAITTLAPLFSLLIADLFALLLPNYFLMQQLNIIGYIGVIVAVLGAMFATIGYKIWDPKKRVHHISINKE